MNEDRKEQIFFFFFINILKITLILPKRSLDVIKIIEFLNDKIFVMLICWHGRNAMEVNETNASLLKRQV